MKGLGMRLTMTRFNLKQPAALCVASLLIGCTTIETKYVTVPVECPVKGVLPKIKKEELACISQVTYDKLRDRENTILDYAIELEANAGCKNASAGKNK